MAHKAKKILLSKAALLAVMCAIFIALVGAGVVYRTPDAEIEPELSEQAPPSAQKVADGVWTLHNQDPVKQVLAKGPEVDVNLKENGRSLEQVKVQNAKVKSSGQNSKIEEIYKWSVALPSGTKFEFGRQQVQGVEPIVRITRKDGQFVRYVPAEAQAFVTPKVNKNVVEWEITPGIKARYTMQKDRVKADYIVNDKWLIVNGQRTHWNGKLDFEVSHSEGLNYVLLPTGDMAWLNENEKEVFTFPVPVIQESVSEKQDSKEWNGRYDSRKLDERSMLLSVILPQDRLNTAAFPLIVDPVVIDSSSVDATSTSLGNGRHIVRDAWGNLITVFEGGLAEGDVWYKPYNTNTWSEAVIGISGPGNAVAIDIDSQGNVHTLNDVANGTDGDIGYMKLTVTRNGSNAITSIAGSSELKLEDSNLGFRPTLIVANKGEGAGKEKIVASWAMNTNVGGTTRNEMRLLQCDVADTCTTASNWKNAIETINAGGACSQGVSGIPLSSSCAGAADIVLQVTGSHSLTHGVVMQMPGRPKRTPEYVYMFDGAVFTFATNGLDNNLGTSSSLSSLDTTDDYLYIGDSSRFTKLTFDLDSTNSNASTIEALEYWNGASWAALSNVIDNTSNGTASFFEEGSILFDMPSNWQTTTVNSVSRYWIRYRPTAAFDASVTVTEYYIGDRNARALLMVAGTDSADDLGSSYIPWNDITDSGWENNPVAATSSWRESVTALDTLGGNWTTFTNYPLSATVDYVNNNFYVAHGSDDIPDVIGVYVLRPNIDPSSALSWSKISDDPVGDPLFATFGSDGVVSLASDGESLYMFYILDPGTTNLVWRKCTPTIAGAANICDHASDWGSENTLVADTTLSHPQVVVSKVSSDTVAFDIIYTDTTDLDVLYERHYAQLADNTITVASSGDDAVNFDCESSDLQSINSAGTSSLGAWATGCDITDDALNNFGVRFTNVNVPSGAHISSAFLDFRVRSRVGSGPIGFTVYGEDADSSSIFTTTCDASCVLNRARTTSSVSYSIDFNTTTYRLDVTDLVQEIICRGAGNVQPCVGNFNSSGAWSSGNALSLLLMTTETRGTTNYIEINEFDDASTSIVPLLTISLAPTGKIFSANTTVPIPSGSGSYSNFDKSFSLTDYAAVGLDDNAYATVSASLVPNASASAQPAFMFKVNNSRNENNSKFSTTAIVRSSVPASTKPIHLQVYRGGGVNNWVTVDTDSTTTTNTDITLESGLIVTNLSNYYLAEMSGEACDSDSPNCWTYWRVYQEPVTSGGANQTLSIDYFNVDYSYAIGESPGSVEIRSGTQFRSGSKIFGN